MSSHGTTRFRLHGLSYALLLLGVLVFAWGLQYKLSLYAAPDTVVRHMAHAKLATNNEPASLSGMVAAAQAGPDLAPVWPLHMFVLPVLVLGLLLMTRRQAQEMRAAECPARAPSSVRTAALFFRPPPFRR